MTAKEFLERDESGIYTEQDIYHAMIEFAKIHVQEALKQANDKAVMDILDTDETTYQDKYFGYGDNDISINEDSILNAYPLTNIK